MIRVCLGVVLFASGTCGPRPGGMPIDLPKLDGGADDGGVLTDGGLAVADCRPCDTWGPVQIMGPLPTVLDELSGLAASRSQPGVIYAHNDSGDSARLFAMDEYGRQLAELRLPGAQAVDWEDMALGPCDDGGSCLFLADIGDNLKRRPSYTVYRAREPDLSAARSREPGSPAEVALGFERLPFQYPNAQRYNAETLLSHPLTGDLYVLTKETAGRPGRVFKFPRPLAPDTTVTLIDLGNASVPTPSDVLPTGGAVHPCGTSVLVRMYNRNVELRAAPDAGFETAFASVPVDVPTAIDEPQGEAIAWGPDGQTIYTASEMTGQSLHRVQCARSE